jgi:hypothetical protein
MRVVAICSTLGTATALFRVIPATCAPKKTYGGGRGQAGESSICRPCAADRVWPRRRRLLALRATVSDAAPVGWFCSSGRPDPMPPLPVGSGPLGDRIRCRFCRLVVLLWATVSTAAPAGWFCSSGRRYPRPLKRDACGAGRQEACCHCHVGVIDNKRGLLL